MCGRKKNAHKRFGWQHIDSPAFPGQMRLARKYGIVFDRNLERLSHKAIYMYNSLQEGQT
jgi:hypothetical protein